MKIFHFPILIFVLCSLLSCQQQKISIMSPSKKIGVNFSLDKNGSPIYSVLCNDTTVLKPSAMGLKLAEADLAHHLSIKDAGKSEMVLQSYVLHNSKKEYISYGAHNQVIKFKAVNGINLSIEFRVSDQGVAYRYLISGADSTKIHKIEKEYSSFHLPDSAHGWLSPRKAARSGWKRTQPSYEEYYQADVPVGTASKFHEGWTFPALFHSNNHWILVSETGIKPNYCGSHFVQDSLVKGNYHFAFPEAKEKTIANAAVKPASILPWKTPWRIIEVAKTPGQITESTMTTDYAEPLKLKNTSFIHPGKASWSWVLLKDAATTYKVQKEYIDYAAKMHWQYCLIDALWDTQIGYDNIAKLAKYAATKNVGLWLWYNSNGDWNDAPQTPKNKLFDSATRQAEFAQLHKMGIKGVKVDFFGGDGQSFMAYYQDLLKDAAQAQLMVNFHGTTIPRGLIRTYPNLMTVEAVRGMENVTFNQKDADMEPFHCTILPFTRNAVAPMDYTPVYFGEIPGIQRRTTNGFELALSVVFQSGVQHYAETAADMDKQPDYVVNFMQEVPAEWQKIKFLDGYPGKYVVMARKGDGRWYIGGINGTKQAQTVTLHLGDLHLQNGIMISDGDNNRTFTKTELSDSVMNVTMKPYGGFVIAQK